jgi:2-dehydro-3-deoxyphosphogluconate aldolase / (4S)-4-hydroxy-2-oxoglutarate aldolase
VEEQPKKVLDFEAFIGDVGVIPVVAIPSAEAAIPLARALVEAGLPCAEITFRTSAAGAAIAAIAAQVPELLVGAGTVLSVPQAEEALAAGARFVVAPGFDPAVVDFCLERHVPVVPGVCTPTEVGYALSRGLTVVKLFPAQALGGVPYIKALAAPFGGVRFVPTGGIDAGNLAAYLALPQVAACGGSWMVAKQLIADGAFDTITQLAAEARAIVQRARPAAAPTAAPAGAS